MPASGCSTCRAAPLDAGAGASRALDRRCATPRRCAASARTAPSSSRRARSTTSPQRSAARPDARILAGSTDIGLWVNKMFRDLPRPPLHRRSRRAEADRRARRRALDRRRRVARGRVARARRALADARRGLAALRRRAAAPHRDDGRQRRQRLADRRLGAGADGARRVARPAPRRRDPARAARRLLHRLHEERCSRRASSCRRSRCRSQRRASVRAYKISKRFDCDISAVCAGLAIELDGDGTVVAARLAFGGMAATVQRAARAEAALVGQAWDEAAVAAAQAALASDFAPLTDMRASAAYRLQVAQNLLRRFWLETRPTRRSRRANRASGARWRTSSPRRSAESDAVNRSLDPQLAASRGNGRRGQRRRWHAASARRCRTSRRTCTSPAPRPTSTTCPSSPARCTRRSASRRSRTAASSRSIATRIAAMPGVVAVLVAADIPGPNDCGPVIHDDPILADGVVHYLGQPVFAVIAETRDAGAARRGAGARRR